MAGYDPELAYFEDMDEGGFYRWRTTAEFRARREDLAVLKAVVAQDPLRDEGWRWEVELLELGQDPEPLADGEAADQAGAQAAALAAMQRHGYVPRDPVT